MPLKPQLRATVEVGAGAAVRADRSLERTTEQIQNKVKQTQLEVDESLLKCKETGINNLSVVKSRLADMKVTIDASLMALGPQITASLMASVDECQNLVSGAHESQQELQHSHKTDRQCQNELTAALKHQVQSLQSIIGQQVKSIHEVVAQADQLDHLLCWCKSVVLRVMAERLRWQQHTGGVALHEARAGDGAASFVERCRNALGKLDGDDYPHPTNHKQSSHLDIDKMNRQLVRGVVDTADAVADRFFARVEAKRPEAFVSTKEEIGLLRELLNVCLSDAEKDFVPVEAPKEFITRPQLAQIHRDVKSIGQMNSALRASFIDEIRQTAHLFQDLSSKTDDKFNETIMQQRRAIQKMEDELRYEGAMKFVKAKRDIAVQTTSGGGSSSFLGGSSNSFLSRFQNNKNGTNFDTSAAKGTPDILLQSGNNNNSENTTEIIGDNNINNEQDEDSMLLANDEEFDEEKSREELIKAAASRTARKEGPSIPHSHPTHHQPRPPSASGDNNNKQSMIKKAVSFAGGHDPANSNNNNTNQNNNNSINNGNKSSSQHIRRSISSNANTPSQASLSMYGSNNNRSRTNSSAAFGSTSARSFSPGSRKTSYAGQQHHHAVSPSKSPWKWVPDTKKVVKILLTAQEKQKEKEKQDLEFQKKLEEEREKIRAEVEKEIRKRNRQERRDRGEQNVELDTSDEEEAKRKKKEEEEAGNNKSSSEQQKGIIDLVENTSTKDETEENNNNDKEKEQEEQQQEKLDPEAALDNRVNDILSKLLQASVTDGKKINELLNASKSSKDNANTNTGGEDGANNMTHINDDDKKQANDGDDGNNSSNNLDQDAIIGIMQELEKSAAQRAKSSNAVTSSSSVGGKSSNPDSYNNSTTSLPNKSTTSDNNNTTSNVVKDWGKWKYEGKGVAASNPPPKPPPIDISWITNFVNIAHRKGVIVSPESLLQEFVNEDGIPLMPQNNRSSKNNTRNQQQRSGDNSSVASKKDDLDDNNDDPAGQSTASVSMNNNNNKGENSGEDITNDGEEGNNNNRDENNRNEDGNNIISNNTEHQSSSHHLHQKQQNEDDRPPVGHYNATHKAQHHPSHHLQGSNNNNNNNNSSTSVSSQQRNLKVKGDGLIDDDQQHRIEDDLMRDISENPPFQQDGPTPFESIPSAIISMSQPHSASHSDRVSGVSWTRTKFSAGGGVELEMPTIDVGRTLEMRLNRGAPDSTVRMLEKRTERQNKLTDATSTRLKDAIHYVNNLEKKTDVLVTRYIMGADKVREQKKQKQLDKFHRRQQQLLQQGKLAHNLKLEDISSDDENNNNNNDNNSKLMGGDGKVQTSRTARSSSADNNNNNRQQQQEEDPAERIGHEEAPRSGRLPKASRLFAKTTS